MAHKDIYKRHSSSIIKAAAIGGIFGGAIYIIFNFLFGIRFPDISLLGILISFIIGAILRVLYESYPADEAIKKDTTAEFLKQSILEDEKVELEDISVYNNEYEENQQIKETLKKEKLNIKTTGNAKVIDNDTEKT